MAGPDGVPMANLQHLLHAERVQHELDALVAEGLLHRGRRGDGRIGYWATPLGLAALRDPGSTVQ